MVMAAILGFAAFAIVVYFVRRAVGFTPHVPSAASMEFGEGQIVSPLRERLRPFLDGLVIVLGLTVVVVAVLAPIIANL